MTRLLLLATLSLAAPLFAQRTARTQWETLHVPSAALSGTRRVYVATPAGYRRASRRFPVLVLLDADDEDQFGAAVANLRFLAGRGAAPELILVGIVNGKDRNHDLTPVATGATAKQLPTAGGASTFVDFLLHDALPAVRATYRTLPGTFLAGHSFGGLLALHAASTRSEFSGVVAMSPSLWWSDSTAALGYADSLARLPHPPRIFISSGELEPAISRTTRRMMAHLDSLKPVSLSYSYRQYSGASHGMTPLSLIDGVQYLFEPMSTTRLPVSLLGPSSDSAEVVRAYRASRTAYVAGARSLGFEASALPENLVNDLAYGALTFLQLPRLAVWLFQENVRDYPKSATVYYGLGDGLLALGDTTSAISQFRRGLGMDQQVHPGAAEVKKKLATLEHRRAKTL